MELSKEQKTAVATMEKAFKLMQKAGFSMALMDGSLIYATQSLLKQYPNLGGNYTPTADALQAQARGEIPAQDQRVGTIYLSNIHIDGGGW